MEFFTIVLSSLLGLISPAGVVVDRAAENAIRARFKSVEQLQVRVDNAPSYQLVQGKVDRVRIAGRGLFPANEIRLEALEIETDPIWVNLAGGQRRRLPLKQPLRAGIRLVVTEADLNRALRSPAVTGWLRRVGTRLVLQEQQALRAQRYEFLNPQVEFLEGERFRFQITLRDVGRNATLVLDVESGLEITGGRQFRLIKPIIKLNGDPVEERIAEGIAEGIADRTDLLQLEEQGLTVRFLRFQMTPESLEAATFVQVLPDARF